MHVFKVSFYLTAIIYVLCCQLWLLWWFLAIVAIYCLISYFYPGAQDLSARRKFTLATWQPPSDGLIFNNIKIRLDSVLQHISTYPEDKKPTITHFVIRACGQVLRQSPDMNGKLIFGRFVPYQTCDVCCLVNVDGVNDVGMFLIKDVPNKSIIEIGQEIRQASKKIKPKGGDDTHKKRMGLMKILPSFLIYVLYEVSIFLSSYIGLNIPSIGLEKDALGAMIVSSVGNFGFVDAYTSFFGTVGQWILLTVNAAHEEVVPKDGSFEVAKMLNINCVIDHRYLFSGARGQKLVQIFQSVFSNPQAYAGRITHAKAE